MTSLLFSGECHVIKMCITFFAVVFFLQKIANKAFGKDSIINVMLKSLFVLEPRILSKFVWSTKAVNSF